MIERFSPPILMEFNTWCLTFIQGYNARDFANSLWSSFDVQSVDGTGHETPAGQGLANTFLHNNVVLHGTVEDILLRLKPGARVPVKGVAVPPSPAAVPSVSSETLRLRIAEDEIHSLRTQLQAMRNSKSWRMTAPLRSLRHLF